MLPRIPLLLLAVGNCHVKALLEPTAVPTHADVRVPPLLTGSPTHADVRVPPLPTGSPTRSDVWDTSAPTHPLPTSTPTMSAETSPPSTHPSYSWSTRSPSDMGKGKGGKSGTRSSTRGPGKGKEERAIKVAMVVQPNHQRVQPSLPVAWVPLEDHHLQSPVALLPLPPMSPWTHFLLL